MIFFFFFFFFFPLSLSFKRGTAHQNNDEVDTETRNKKQEKSST